jgi:predicted RNase H-like HicB family nuclease
VCRLLRERCEVSKNKQESSFAEEDEMEYIAYLHKDKNSDYGVSFPDFPGCITAGSSLEEARRMAAEALSFHIAGLQEDGDPIPSPSTLDELRNDPAMKGAVAFPVDAKEPEKTVRINITARESEIAEIDTRARAARLTRSAYMVRRALQTQAAVIELGGLKGKRVSVDSTPRAFRKSRQN